MAYHIAIDIVGFQVFDRANRVECGLHIENLGDDFFLGDIKRFETGCKRL